MSFSEEDVIEIQTDNGEYEQEDRTETIMFSWSVKNFGFGTTTFFYDKGILKCDNETMSKEMIKTLLCKFVDLAEFIS